MALDIPHYAAVVPILREAGGILRPLFGNAHAIAHKSQSPADAVTELDGQIETLIAERLRDHDPSIEFCGEEHGGNNQAERYWLVDPLDGTAHYIRGNFFCTIMLALIESGRVTFAAIYDFMHDEMFVAALGRGAFCAYLGVGAFCNQTRIRVSKRPLAQAYFAYEVDFTRKENLAKWLELQRHCVLMNTINCGFEFSRIASGKLEGRICLDPFGKDWDYAAGSLLVTEAGGVVRNIGSDSYDFRNHTLIATTPAIDKELQKLNLF